MKKLLIIGFVFGLFVFTSCENNDLKDIGDPGNIPGMGNAGGDLKAEVVELHEDIVLGAITGVGEVAQANSLKSGDLTIEGSVHGSGDQVVVTLVVHNTNADECRSLWFRAGSLFEVNLPGYQSGILLAPVNVCIAPNDTKEVELHLYCVNQGKKPSDESASYGYIGVTTSDAILDLIEKLAFRKINFEHYMYYPEDNFSYATVKAKLQEILWAVTNGDGIEGNDEYLSFIKSLPMLPTGIFPEYIYDLDIALPDCWCIDECTEVKNSGALSYIAFATGCGDAPIAELGDNDWYYTNGFPFNVETNYKKTTGTIKFESIDNIPALGEDGRIEIGTFTFTTSCEDEQFLVTVKNKDESEPKIIDVTKVGDAIVMPNGFMVEFVGSDSDGNGGFVYEFNVVSDNCEGGHTKK